MESHDHMLLSCHNPACRRGFMWSRTDLRKRRSLTIKCPHCDHQEPVSPERTPELFDEVMNVSVGERRVVSGNVVVARADHRTNKLILNFRDGERMEIPTGRIADDLETLRDCGVTVAL
jgi:hypothetical protein